MHENEEAKINPLLLTFNIHSPSPTNKQSGNINKVFRCIKANSTGEVFLRVTPVAFRSRELIEAEVQWLEALAEAGVAVGRPLRSRNGERSVELELQSGEQKELGLGQGKYVATAFLSVGGRPAERPVDFTPGVVRAWAQMVARLHKFNREYEPDSFKRLSWGEDRVLQTALRDNSPQTAMFRSKLSALMKWMEAVPKSVEVFGLTHADLHIANFHVLREDPVEIGVFDFDDCCYHWYVHDLAVAVTQLRKQRIEDSLNADATRDMAALEVLFLEEYFRCAQPSADARAQMQASLEGFVAFRGCLIMCWASSERAAKALTGPVQEAWFAKSLPVYQQLVFPPVLEQR